MNTDVVIRICSPLRTKNKNKIKDVTKDFIAINAWFKVISACMAIKLVYELCIYIPCCNNAIYA